MNNPQIIEEKVGSYIQEHDMIVPGEKVLVGVSGGADSVCLLFLLAKITPKIGASLEVVHVHHGIRETADRDRIFVEQLCDRLAIPFHWQRVDVPELAREQKLSTEEAGRIARYNCFSGIAPEIGATKIALAHNKNDRAETMLFHLFRGTGLRGLGSIKPCRMPYIRPILCLEREEIEEYLKGLGQDFCQDETNDEDDYTRNRIRHHILPYAKQEISAGAVEHMCITSDFLAEAEDYIALGVENLKKSVVSFIENGTAMKIEIDAQGFLNAHRLLQGQLLLDLIKTLTPKHKDISKVHVDEVKGLFHGDSGKQVSLPFGIQAYREYGKIILEQADEAVVQEEPVLLMEDGKLVNSQVTYGNFKVFLEVFPYEKNVPIPENQYTKWFDYDKIKTLVLRGKQTGDYLTIQGNQGQTNHKSLKDYMITEKIPARQRPHVPLFCENDHVLWVAGYRVSQAYKVEEHTKSILQVRMIQPD